MEKHVCQTGSAEQMARGPAPQRVRRRLGVIAGDTFVPARGSTGSAGAAAARTPTLAHGAEGSVALVGAWPPGAADGPVDADGTRERMEHQAEAKAEMIAQAVGRARELVDGALAALGNVEANRAILEAHFHTAGAEGIQQIEASYHKIRNAFSGAIPLEVEIDTDAGLCVYTLWTDIHLCPPWFQQAPGKRAGTLIHEMSHKYAGTDDEAYHHHAAYASLAPGDALDNADSYQWFALDLVGYTE